MAGQYYEGVGRRKRSVARVRVSAGTGAFTVNDKQVAEYFTRFGDVEAILGPQSIRIRAVLTFPSMSMAVV